jgi:hypothetical protein
MVESYIRTVEEHLQKVIASHQRDWDARLPVFSWLTGHQLNTTGLTPVSVVFRREL